MPRRTDRRTPIVGYELDRTPIIEATRTPKGNLQFWCEYCCNEHYHGKPLGHRVAHCSNPVSPFRETGYVLVEAGQGAALSATP